MIDIFTVIVLLYNNKEFLNECLDSILCQNHPNIEIIVVDDGSELFEKEKIMTYLEDNKTSNVKNIIVYQNKQNIGTVRSANGAIKRATGTYIKLLAADDALYDSNSLANAAKALKSCSSGIIIGDVMRCDNGLIPVAKYRDNLLKIINTLEPMDVFRRLCVHNDIVAGGVFFASSFFGEYGLFDESYRLIEDWPTWLNATKKGCRFKYVPFYTIRYRSNGGIGTGVNPVYMSDKKKVLESIIIPSKKEIGLIWYLKARVSFAIINFSLIRRIYGIIFRNGK